MGVADERDTVGDRLQRPPQAEPRGGLARRTTAGAARGRDAVGGAGQVEQVGALGLVELQRSGQGVEDAGGGAGDLAALEAGVVLDAQPGERGDLAAPQSGHAAGAGGRQADLVRGDPGAAGGEELAHLLRRRGCPRHRA